MFKECCNKYSILQLMEKQVNFTDDVEKIVDDTDGNEKKQKYNQFRARLIILCGWGIYK